jgi:6-pyruvoyltetrahydropterin/6-carboxytetrahydropterin synthase
MFRITVERSFNASHQLALPNGEKEALHAHDWLVRARVRAAKLDSMGLVMDFHRLEAQIDAATAPLAGKRLEQLDDFSEISASAEYVARYIFEKIERELESRVHLESVEVMETPGCWAGYGAD